jgi:hypothetical protein
MRLLRSINKAKTCYQCCRIATTDDHIPPKCFFPEAKTIGGENLRKDLITVPSCRKHNLERSGDDQFICSIIASQIQGNKYAQHLFHTKVIKAIKRRPLLAPGFFRKLFPIRIGKIETGVFYPDKKRIDRTMSSISKGLFFYHFKRRPKGLIGVLAYDIQKLPENQASYEYNLALAKNKQDTIRLYQSEKRNGENPQIFYYQIISEEKMNRIVIRMVFFEGIIFDAIFKIN